MGYNNRAEKHIVQVSTYGSWATIRQDAANLGEAAEAGFGVRDSQAVGGAVSHVRLLGVPVQTQKF